MRLYQIGRDKWTVYAIANDDGSCDLLTTLAEQSDNDLGARMLALLREHVPTHGPSKNREVSKPLRDGILEFRRQPNRGPALRALYFYDAGNIIVCSHAIWKSTEKVPPEEINRAIAARERYRIDKAGHRLQIELMPKQEGPKRERTKKK